VQREISRLKESDAARLNDECAIYTFIYRRPRREMTGGVRSPRGGAPPHRYQRLVHGLANSGALNASDELAANPLLPQVRPGRGLAERWPRPGREMAERWPRDGREMAERWPRDGRSALPPATSPDEPSRAEPSPPPQDILLQAVPGNLRRADSFVLFLKRLVAHLKKRLQTEEVVQETPLAFLSQLLHEEESFLDTS